MSRTAASVPCRTVSLRVGRWLPIAAILVWTGCPNKPPAPPPSASPSLVGTTVELSAPGELRLAEQWRLNLDEWTAQTGGEFRLHEIPADVSTSLPPPEAALAIVKLEQIPDLLAADWLSPIDDPDALADWEELCRGLRNGIARPAGEPQVIPTACPVLAVYYRADLLEAAGRRPPRTWEEYHALLDELPAWSGGLPALEPWSPAYRSTLWLARAASYALHPDSVSVLLDLQDAAPQISGPAFLRALEESLTALKLLDPQSLEFGPEQCCRAVLDGRAAIAIGLAPSDEAGGRATVGEAPRLAESAVVGTALLPGAARIYERSAAAWEPADEAARVTLIGHGGYAMCVARSADGAARQAAWNLWNSVRGNAEDDDLPFGPAVCRARDMPAAQRQPAYGFDPSAWQQHLETTIGALQDTRVLLEMPLPESARFRDALTVRLSAAMDGSTAPADALAQAAADWRVLIDELGRERVLNVYRQCHGLMPL